MFSPKAYRISRSEELWLGRQNAPRTQPASKKLLEEPSQAKGSKTGLGRQENLSLDKDALVSDGSLSRGHSAESYH